MLTFKTAVHVKHGPSRMVNMRLIIIVLNVVAIIILLARLLPKDFLKENYTDLGFRTNKTAKILLNLNRSHFKFGVRLLLLI